MILLEMEYHGITPTQKLRAFAYKFYQYHKWEPKVGDYYTISRDDDQLYRIVGETETHFHVGYSDSNSNVQLSSSFEKKGFADSGFGVNRVFVPTWAFSTVVDARPVDFENSYYLRNTQTHSPFTAIQIRAMFEKLNQADLYPQRFKRHLNGCYINEYLQVRWEGFHAGFRYKEDMLP